MLQGYLGKILRAGLTKDTVTEEKLPAKELVEKAFGGI
jgi:hypothetical protein